MKNLIRSIAALGIVAAGLVLMPKPAIADVGIIKGCWYTPPDPPACDICQKSCDKDQECCIILHL